jgi:hypothetical protein
MNYQEESLQSMVSERTDKPSLTNPAPSVKRLPGYPVAQPGGEAAGSQPAKKKRHDRENSPDVRER